MLIVLYHIIIIISRVIFQSVKFSLTKRVKSATIQSRYLLYKSEETKEGKTEQ